MILGTISKGGDLLLIMTMYTLTQTQFRINFFFVLFLFFSLLFRPHKKNLFLRNL